MARYIKANPQVAKYLNLETDRNTVADGNYLLWQADMLVFGPLTELNNTLAMIGGIALMPHEAREEQDGTVIRPLPTPTDERFIYNPPVDDPQAETEETEETEETTEQPEGETQAPNEETPVEGSGETEQQGDSQEPAAEEPTGEDQTEGSGESEQQPEAEAPANDAAEDQPEPEAETPTDQPEDENGESQEITAGDVGSVEDLVDFAPAEETE